MSVESLKAMRKKKKDSKKKYEKRKSQLESIIKNLDNKMDDDVRDINKKIEQCVDEYSGGISGVAGICAVADGMVSEKEVETELDGTMSSCRYNLRQDINRCNNRIESLRIEIRNLEQQIQDEGGTIYFWE